MRISWPHSCGKPRSELYDPFCSKRCADVDLHPWLKGSYVIPGANAKPEPSADEDSRSGRRAMRHFRVPTRRGNGKSWAGSHFFGPYRVTY